MDDKLQIACQLFAFRNQVVHSCFRKNIKRSFMCCHRKNGGIAHLPRFCRWNRDKSFFHFETSFFIVSPPSGKHRQVCIMMFFMNENSTHASGKRVEIFIRTPTGEIHVPIVKSEFDVSCCMCEIKPHHSSCVVCCFGD